MRTALAALALAAGGAQAAEQLPKFKPSTLYSDARASLIGLGWQPAPVPASSRECDQRESTCEAYPEAERCTPFGSAACSMLWKRGQQLISVTTIGDIDILVRSASCRSGC